MATIDAALKIPGFMQYQELMWLATQAETHSRIAEIGSLVGRSTRALADNTKGWVLAIDDQKGPRDATMSWKERQSIPVKFRENLLEHIESGKVIPWIADHAKICSGEVFIRGAINVNTSDPIDFDFRPLAEQSPTQFDMVFIDGDHKLKSVERDLAFWAPLVEPGGLLCGHDYDLAYPGVIEGTSNAFGNTIGIVPDTSIWFYVVPVPVVVNQEMAVAQCQ